jgi:predicted RND superfamily exporter protein
MFWVVVALLYFVLAVVAPSILGLFVNRARPDFRTLSLSLRVVFVVLLGVGVAFKIYYIMAWRAGRTNLLQSTLTRAVFFSALTTATAFGSLWLSDQPGMSSMGKLMALALVCTLAAAVLFQPALMGPPRGDNARNVA